MPPRPRTRPSKRIADDLRARLLAGEWAADDPMPSVAELARHYAASRTTVLKALHALAGEGLITIIPKYGTYANARPEPPGN